MSQPLSPKTEHRIDKRTAMTCPVYVHGITKSGERIKTHAITDNISQSGLYLQTPKVLKLGSVVFTIIGLLSGARLAVRGKVVRVEKKGLGLSGLAVCFSQHRIIPAL